MGRIPVPVFAVLAACASFAATWMAQVPAKHDVGLQFVVGAQGLTSITYHGAELLLANYGRVTPGAMIFVRPDQTTYTSSDPGVVTKPAANIVLQTYPWGTVKATYTGEKLQVKLLIEVHNATHDLLQTLPLRLLALQFSETPDGYIYEGGMWGGSETTAQLAIYPMASGYDASPALITISSPEGVLRFSRESFSESAKVEVPFALDGTRLTFPMMVSMDNIGTGETRLTEFAFRMAPANAQVITDFRDAHPFVINWTDRRPIGAVFLASTGINVATNPGRWMVQSGNVDTSTPGGLAAFQNAVIQWAHDSVAAHLAAGAQGMIQWDIEGQRIGQTFYGAPDRMSEIAPEMESTVTYGGVQMPLADAYFQIFRDAQLKVGVCLRPQRVYLSETGFWSQLSLNDDESYLDLKNSITYAKNRWGCTLFYVDSSLNISGPLDPAVFEQLAIDFPDILMMPENQAFRYYASTAPLDSMYHHGVHRTLPSTREVWPQAFSVIMAPGGTSIQGDIPSPEVRAARRAKMVDGMQHGDIYIFNGWYQNSGAQEIASMYQEANE